VLTSLSTDDDSDCAAALLLLTMMIHDWCVDVPFFAEALARYDRQHKMVLEIPEKRPLGLLLVDAAKLKQALIPNPLQCLNVWFHCTMYNTSSSSSSSSNNNNYSNNNLKTISLTYLANGLHLLYYITKILQFQKNCWRVQYCIPLMLWRCAQDCSEDMANLWWAWKSAG